MDALCPACGDWPLEPEDRFCGHCGALVALGKIEFRATESRRGGVSLSVALADGEAVSEADADEEADQPLPLGDLELIAVSIEKDGRETRINPVGVTADQLAGSLGAPLIDESKFLTRNESAVLALRPVVGRGTPRKLGRETLAVHIAGEQDPPNLEPLSHRLLSDAVTSTDTGGRILVRLRNSGGAAMIENVRLQLHGVAGADVEAPDLAEPVFAPPGQEVVAPAWLSRQEVVAATRAGNIQATLTIRTSDHREQSFPKPLERWGPPKAELITPSEIRALAGRRARLAARLVNTGGATVSIDRIEARWARSADELSHESWTEVPVPADWMGPLGAGERMDAELRPRTPELDAGETTRAFAVELRILLQAEGATVPPVTSRNVIKVMELAPFVGRVCVDFGTTETAAAAILGSEPDDPEPGAPPKTPFVVELASVLLPDGPRERRFIQTLVVKTEDNVLRCGDDAMAVLAFEAAAEPGVLTAPERRIEASYSSFKWDLAHADVAVAFLRYVKALIEEHPKVTGLIGPGTVMFATCPTRFTDDQRGALQRAFLSAGFPDPLTTWLDVENGEDATFIAESWSPLPYALFAEPARFESLGDTGIRQVLPELQNHQSGHIVIYDVGGGSADFSVLRVEQNGYTKRITETGRNTETHFAGLKFAERIETRIRDWARRKGWAIEHGPVAGQALRRAVKTFQHRPGILSSAQLEGPFEAYFQDWSQMAVAERLQRARELFTNALFSGGDQIETTREYLRSQMSEYLPLRFGSAAEKAVIQLKDIPELAGDILADFAEAFHKLVEDMDKSDLKAQLAKDDSAVSRVRLIPSGRGAAFPLADALIRQKWSAEITSGLEICRLPPIESKSITSWGGLHMCDLARLGGGLQVDFGALTDDLHVKNGTFDPVPLPWRDMERTVALVRLSDLEPHARMQRTVRVGTGRKGSAGFVQLALIEYSGEVGKSLSQHWAGVIVRADVLEPILAVGETLEEAVRYAKEKLNG